MEKIAQFKNKNTDITITKKIEFEQYEDQVIKLDSRFFEKNVRIKKILKFHILKFIYSMNYSIWS